jgi:RND family efflux transporter MFP subunit
VALRLLSPYALGEREPPARGDPARIEAPALPAAPAAVQSPPGPAAVPAAAAAPAGSPARSAEHGARSFDCLISAHDVVSVGSAAIGVIEDIFVERGDSVQAGQLLAVLESKAERAALKLAQARTERLVDLQASEAQLALRRRQRERTVALFESESVSLDQREQAENAATQAALEHRRAKDDLHLAALQLEQARALVQRRMITSPITGIVVERMLSRGEVVNEEQAVVRVAEIDRLRVEVILPAQMFGQVRVGENATIVTEPPYDRPRQAQVVIVDPIIDAASGTFGVRLLIPNPARELPGGLRCQVRFPGVD